MGDALSVPFIVSWSFSINAYKSEYAKCIESGKISVSVKLGCVRLTLFWNGNALGKIPESSLSIKLIFLFSDNNRQVCLFCTTMSQDLRYKYGVNKQRKKKENVNWNFSKASLCRQDLHEFILERR